MESVSSPWVHRRTGRRVYQRTEETLGKAFSLIWKLQSLRLIFSQDGNIYLSLTFGEKKVDQLKKKLLR